MSHLVDHHRHWALALLFLLVMVESFGIPLPGETALIAAGVLASQHALVIWEVIVAAAVAAILGDNLGYLAARKGGRDVLERWQITQRYARRLLPRAERFFAKHGGKTVFIGRFIAVLRFTAAWIAGLSRMPWRRFLVWNAAGGIAWATTIGLVAYYAGHAAAAAIQRYGLYAALTVAAVTLLGLLILRRLERAALDDN